MASRVKTVIIPAAGQGTRLLPATKSTPKELLPVYDRPILQFAIDEAVRTGAERIVVVTSPDKPGIERYLVPHHDLVRELSRKGKAELAGVMGDLCLPQGTEIVFARQDRPQGLGDAIVCAHPHVLPGAVGVILPDDVILGYPCLPQMAEHYCGGHMVAAMEVSEAETALYGIFALAGPAQGDSIPAAGMVEKPARGQAPSRLAAVGRYILDPVVFRTLGAIPFGAGGELQLTDAIGVDAATIPLTAFRFWGTRYDCGNHEGLFEASMARRMQVRSDAATAASAPALIAAQ